jgi:hypothetical protein
MLRYRGNNCFDRSVVPRCRIGADRNPAPRTIIVPKTSEPSAHSEMSLEEWHAKMSAAPLPHKGCFVSAFPGTWQEVPCKPAPLHPQLGKTGGPVPLNVGSGNDYFATAVGGT